MLHVGIEPARVARGLDFRLNPAFSTRAVLRETRSTLNSITRYVADVRKAREIRASSMYTVVLMSIYRKAKEPAHRRPLLESKKIVLSARSPLPTRATFTPSAAPRGGRQRPRMRRRPPTRLPRQARTSRS
ncbi:hypothetical protein NUW54_g13625 [Trametes sanguinea]|uniref:Uncharacterized protein n=1 Tax=Trametes sanguinea TaxID=158606 RepID=A0ACC1MLE4_9APHY|nr:hypothetical protein NUW54_g13625 [Trametes sanguinea]